MDVDVDQERASVHAPPAAEAAVILLDTNALLWIEQRHRRSRMLTTGQRLYLSPATLLELQVLLESGRMRPLPGVTPAAIAADERWLLDDVPSARWFTAATEVVWTRDPFDRLIVAHARLRGWKLATSDGMLLEHLSPSECVPL
jgi:PIN domain nuclease of toxin-antitoxin system